MSARRLVADALELIDEHARSAMPEGAYLELANKMKSIHDQVHEPGAPEDLIGHIEALLRSDIEDYDLIAACARALGDLVEMMSIEDRASVMVGVMPTIIALLSVDSDEVKAQAAWTLSKMAYYDDDRTGSAFSGAIPPLIDLLNADSGEVKQSAAYALAMLAMDHADRAATIVALGAIPPLISMLSDTVVHRMRYYAAEALASLAHDDANAVAIASSGAIFPLIAMLSVGDDNEKLEAARALGMLARNDGNKAKITSSGAILPLTALLNGSVEIKCLHFSDLIKTQAKRALKLLNAPAADQDAHRGRKKMKTSHTES